MAEGGFDDFEMEERNDEYRNYGDEQLEEKRLSLEEELKDAYGEDEMLNFNRIDNEITRVRDELVRRYYEKSAETSFIDSDGGKTVTIKGPSSGTVEVPSVEFDKDDIPSVDFGLGKKERSLISKIKTSQTKTKKDFFEDFIGEGFKKGNGKSSKKLYNGIKLRYDLNKVKGIEFEGRNVVVLASDGKTLRYPKIKQLVLK